MDKTTYQWKLVGTRLNPVTGWPSFGLRLGAGVLAGQDILILLLDGQVLDPAEAHPLIGLEKVLILLLDGQVLDSNRVVLRKQVSES